MSLAESTRPEVPLTRRPSDSTVVALGAAVLTATFVLTSAVVSTLPAFKFESQFPALLPFFAWAAALGVGAVSGMTRGLVRPWRSAHGVASLVPYVALMMLSAAAPEWDLPWWLSVIAAASAAAPFALLAARARTPLVVAADQAPDDASLRGTFMVGLALMLMAWAVSGSVVTGAVVSVLLAVALAVASMMPGGLAKAAHTWRLGHWVALTWGSVVVWVSVLLRGLTSFFADPWWVFTAVVLTGLPLIVANSLQARRR
ncbi:MAG: hypothetical protein ACLGHZ_10000 [Actinomycetes bacterium]